jgi:hypothetical protein
VGVGKEKIKQAFKSNFTDETGKIIISKKLPLLHCFFHFYAGGFLADLFHKNIRTGKLSVTYPWHCADTLVFNAHCTAISDQG